MAVQVNELRIGNWVKYESGSIVEVSAAIIETIEETDGIKFNPISLTPELLIKFGFKQKAVMGDTRIAWDNGMFLFFEDEPEITKGLHWLQNYIFFRTGQELIYNQ